MLSFKVLSNGNLMFARTVLISLLAMAFTEMVRAEVAADRAARLEAKPWFTRKMRVANVDLPLSPVSILVMFLSIVYLVSNWSGKPSYCEASHILLSEQTNASRDTLIAMKEEIKNDPLLFAKRAKKFSSCPSKNNGGQLGRFKKHVMAPSFDRLCFDPSTPLKTVVGPVQTQFGWHLIYITDRVLGDAS